MFVAWMEAILNTPMADNVFCRWNLSKVYVMNQQVLIYQGDGEPFLVGVCVFVIAWWRQPQALFVNSSRNNFTHEQLERKTTTYKDV